MISLYTDGSSSGRGTGAIGWAWVLVRDGEVVLCGYGGLPDGTNQRAELMAAVEGLKVTNQYLLDHDCDREEIELVSDSKYVLGLASGAHKASKNLDLVEDLIWAAKITHRLRWVPGHSREKSLDAEMNNRCDTLSKRGKAEARANAEEIAKRSVPEDPL